MNPEWLTPHNSLAALYVLQGKPEEAIAKFEQALEVDPNSAGTYLSLAMLYEQTGKYDKAMAVYERALAKNSKFWPAANNLAFLLSEHAASPENLDRALRLVQQAQEVRPNEPELLDTLGWVYYKMGNAQRAAEIIGQAQSADPTNAILNYHLGVVLANTDRKEEARQHLQDAVNSGQNFTGLDKARELLKSLQ